MKNLFKRVVSIILVIMTMLSTVNITVIASEIYSNSNSGDYKYIVNADNSSVTITGYSGSSSTLVIPGSIDTMTVTAINSYSFSNLSFLQSVRFPDTIVSISSRAFYNCSNLTYVELPVSWQQVPDYNTNSTSNYHHLSDYYRSPFDCCYSLSTVIVPAGMTVIPRYAFRNLPNIKHINLPNSIMMIGSHAFQNSGIRSIDIPDNVTYIGSWTFQNCTYLEKIDFPEKLTKIESFAFENCNSLTSILLPDTITHMSGRAFYNCNNLQNVNIPMNWSYVPDWNYNSLDRYNYGSSYYSSPFEGCGNITKLVIPCGKTDIPRNAFRNLYSLKELYVPATVGTKMGGEAFTRCNKMVFVCLPNSYIESYAKQYGYSYRYYNSTSDNVSIWEKIDNKEVSIIPNDAIGYDGNYFKLYDSSMTWNQAKVACEQLGGYLVTITSSKEQSFVQSLIEESSKHYIWIGGSLDKDRVFHWVTNEDTTYQYWEEGQPNNGGGCEDKVMIYSPLATKKECGPWNDAPNDDSLSEQGYYGFICEWEGTQSGEYTSSSPVLSTDTQQITEDLKFDTNNLLSNLNCGYHSIKGPHITFLGETFYLFEFGGSISIPLNDQLNLQAEIDPDKKSIEVLLGFEEFNGSADVGGIEGDNKYWSESYQQVKTLYQNATGKKVDTTKLWNDFSSLRGKLKKLDANMVLDASGTVTGYLEFSYESGNVKFSEGGILVEASVGSELTGRVPGFPVAYFVMGLNASVNGKIAVAYEKQISLNTEMLTELTAYVGVGMGVKKGIKTYIEGGFAGTLGLNIIAKTGMFAADSDYYNPLTVTIQGSVYLKGVILGWEPEFANKKWPLGEPVQLYPRNDVSLNEKAKATRFVSNTSLTNATPIERDYLNNNRLFAYATATADDKIYSDTSVYDYNAPILTALSDGRLLMLWVDDLGAKNDVNKTSLMYSIYDGTVWSTPLEIYEIGTYNGEPVIYNDGINVYIVWDRAKTVLADNASLEELIAENEIYYTCFDGSDFSTPVAITDNTLFETNYSIVSSEDRVAVAWIENSDNDPISSSGTNTVYTRECIDGVWQTSVLVASYTQPVSEIAVYYNGDELYCAYTLTDAENNSDIYINSLELTEGEYMSYEDGYIYYLSDSSICKYDTVTGETIELNIDGVSNFSVSEGNLYTLVSTGFTCEMYESICTDGVYSEWKQVTEYDRYIRNYSVTTDSTGEPIYALNLVSVDEDAEEIYGNSELAVCKAEKIEAIKATAVYYDYNAVKPSADLELNVDVTNIGNTDFDTATVQILDDDGNIVSSKIVDAQLVAGETTTLNTVYTLPAELTKQDIYVNVLVSDNERELSDNSVYTTIGYGDIAVNDLTVEKTENGAVVKGMVTNVGYTDISDVSISVYNSSIPDEIFSTISCGDISVGREYSFEYSIPEEYLTLEDKMTMYGLTFKAEATDEESNYANNSDKVVFGELTDYTVTFVDGNEILNVLSVDEFESYIPEKEGYTFVSWHTSPFLTDGSEVTEISDDISENIMVYAKWKDVPVVTVENYNVTITCADQIKDLRYALGEYTTTTEIRNAEGNVAISNTLVQKYTVDGKFVYEMPKGGYYTVWVRMQDGTNYILPLDVTHFTPTVSADGVTVTIHDLYNVKDFYIAKGEYETYREIKDNGYIVSISGDKIGTKHDYTYTVYEPGVHTILIRYNDATTALFHEELTVDEPVFTTNGLQVTIGNIPNVKVIRTAYGEYYTLGDTKRAEGARNFSNKSVIKNAEDYTIQYREEGMVTIVVEYNNGYVKVFHYDVQKKSPTVEQNGNIVSLDNLDGLYVIRYAEGEYTSPKQIKSAPGNRVIKSEDLLDGNITVTLNPGIYTFYVQYDDESYNYYNIVVE